MILALAGCARTVSVVGDDPHGEPWSPDTADGDAPGSADPTPDQGCEAAAGLPTGRDLQLDWCARVSPEPDQSWPGAGARCGFFNLTGAFGASGVAAWPGSGALVPVGDEWLGAMLDIDAGDAVETVPLDAEGAVVAGPFRHDTGPVTKLGLSRSTPRLAAYVDDVLDGSVAGVPIPLGYTSTCST